MWYTLYCRQEEEQNIINICQHYKKKGVLRDVFVFTSERMKRYQGQWHKETVRMFPESLFLELSQQELCSDELKKFHEYVGTREDEKRLDPVSVAEEEFLKGLCGKKHHLGMSSGVIENGNTYVTRGPLAGMEKQIYNIDRHKRLARLYVPIRQTKGELVAGLEITEKS